MTFTDEDVQDQRDLVEALRYRREDLYNKYNEAWSKYSEILVKELEAKTKLNIMESK